MVFMSLLNLLLTTNMDSEQQVSEVAMRTEDRQWDCRFNISNEEYLDNFIETITTMDANGKFKYILVSGIEIGTQSQHDDYGKKHVHVAIILNNRMSKQSLLRNLKVDTSLGYYLVPRNRKYPYSGWRKHHTKIHSKINPDSLVLYENGELPVDVKEKKSVALGPEEKKRKLDDILLEMKSLIENDNADECFRKFPRNYLTYGEKIKAMVHQKRNFFKDKRDPNIWVHGFAGTGKTTVMAFVYPNYYKKNLTNKFFDLYDGKIHTHIMLEDLDHQAVERLGINFIKTICDEAGFPIDQKYKTPQLIQSPCLVTSNFTINDILSQQENTVGLSQNIPALLRRFYHVRIDELLRLLQIKLLPKWDRVKLQKEGNSDMGKLFITWDYVSDTPMCVPLKEPEYYQTVIRDHYYL